jgi:hypothetical protein
VLVCDAHDGLALEGPRTTGRAARTAAIVASAAAGAGTAAEVTLAPIACRWATLAWLAWRPLFALATVLSRAAAWWSAKLTVARGTIVASAVIARRTGSVLASATFAGLRGGGVCGHEPELTRRCGTPCTLRVEKPDRGGGDLDSVVSVKQRLKSQHFARGDAL